MKKLLVNQRNPFVFDESIIKQHGEYSIAPEYQTLNLPPNFCFSLDDTTFICVEGNANITGLEFRQQVLSENYVPLDAYCANAIYQNKEMLSLLGSLWWNTQGGFRNDNRLYTINFFGSIVVRSDKVPHTVSFGYEEYESLDNPTLMPYEALEKSWSKHRDYAIVFKKEFSDTFLKN